MNTNICPICHGNAKVVEHDVRDLYTVDCSRCERYDIAGSAASVADAMPDDKRWLVSAWIVHNPQRVFDSGHIEFARQRARQPSLAKRALAAMKYLAVHFPQGQFFSLNDLISKPEYQAFLAHSWTKDIREVQFVFTQLLVGEFGYVSPSQNGSSCLISAKGWLALEGQKNSASTIGFIAMWFDESMRQFHDLVVDPAIRESGYEPLRIDNKEHTNKIDDEIVASIRASRFVVADYTGGRGGVYYEAGFAHGLGLPVFFMARDGEQLHFDVRQYNTIFWKTEDLADARERLKNRILATIGRGPLKTT